MPNRIIKESICTSDSIDGLGWFEECFFYRLIVNCDDYGRMDARPSILRARLFPLKSVTDKQVDAALQSLRTAAMIDLYAVDGRSFLQLRTWENHQQIRAKRSKFPAPDSICNQMIPDDSKCPRNPIQSESESESESNPRGSDGRAAPTPPNADYDFFISTYNGTCSKLPACKLLTDKRKRAIRDFLKQLSQEQFIDACRKANDNDFCTGDNDRGWKADFDFLIRADKAISVLEGKYDGKAAGFSYDSSHEEGTSF